MSKVIVNVYKSPNKDETYLYVSIQDDLKRVPEELLETFGKPELVTKIVVTAEKQLARAEGKDVLDAMKSKGFYLQLPPPREDYMLDLYDPNAESAHNAPGQHD